MRLLQLDDLTTSYTNARPEAGLFVRFPRSSRVRLRPRVRMTRNSEKGAHHQGRIVADHSSSHPQPAGRTRNGVPGGSLAPFGRKAPISRKIDRFGSVSMNFLAGPQIVRSTSPANVADNHSDPSHQRCLPRRWAIHNRHHNISPTLTPSLSTTQQPNSPPAASPGQFPAP